MSNESITPKNKFECKNCKSMFIKDRERDVSDFKCCENPLPILLATEYSEEEYESINLQNLHRIYKENLHIEDTDRIDVVLATALSRKLEGIPLWLLLVGPSGDMKSVQLNAIRGDEVFVLHNLTAKTLANGHKNKKEYPDLAPELNNKIVIIPDMSQILKLPPVDKAQVWAQLRDLYDGHAGKISGQGSRANYKDLKITLLGGSTPVIDGQILIHQDLGTRELIYRTKGSADKETLIERCFKNEEAEEKIKKLLQKTTTDFITKTEINRKTITPKTLKEIKAIAIFISLMRATAEFDNYTQELRNQVYPEEPTRIAKQLKRMYICLMSLEENYPESTALRILWHIAKSSAFPTRVKILALLIDTDGDLSTTKIAHRIKIGKSTVMRECSVLQNVGIIDCRNEPTTYPDKYYYFWKAKETLPFDSEIFTNHIRP